MKLEKIISVSTLIYLTIVGAAKAQNCTPAPVGCTNADYSNAFLNSSNPNTIEYDNIVSTFHSTMARQSNGNVLVWGETMNGTTNTLTAKNLNSTNYPTLTGTVLKFTGGSVNINTGQFVVLTTTGLFTWGNCGTVVSESLTSTCNWSENMTKLTVNGKTDGLPAGISPSDVKMMFGSSRSLAIVTCNGEVWTLTQGGQFATGDNTSSPFIWHRVKVNANTYLSNVVAVRGADVKWFNYSGFVALKNDGTIWTWGTKTYLGDGTPATDRAYATQMAIPTGVVPKMIGMTSTANNNIDNTFSYYLLSTNGSLYSLGSNDNRQLGIWNSTEQTSWVRVRKSATSGDYLTNIVWISPNEHDGSGGMPAVTALQNDGSLWAWGYNSFNMLGEAYDGPIDPTKNFGGLGLNANIFAMELGGHTTIAIKQCSKKFGYVGHYVNGSMANGSAGGGSTVGLFDFNQTANLDLCGASTIAKFANISNSIISLNTPYTLSVNLPGGNYNIISGNATVSPSGILTALSPGNILVEYEITSPCPSKDTLILNASIPTPVELIKFDLTKIGKNVQLNWVTKFESNLSGFEIERSIDGDSWSTIGFVNSQKNDGNSQSTTSYYFTDTALHDGTIMYRLKQLDFNGAYTYSPIRKLNYEAKKIINIFPNPFNNSVTIEGLTNNDILKIYDMTGKMIDKFIASPTGTLKIDFTTFNSGLYNFVITDTNGLVSTTKVRKQ